MSDPATALALILEAPGLDEAHDVLDRLLRDIRAAALEEAASVCMNAAEPEITDTDRTMEARSLLVRCAATIRALKDNKEEVP